MAKAKKPAASKSKSSVSDQAKPKADKPVTGSSASSAAKAASKTTSKATSTAPAKTSAPAKVETPKGDAAQVETAATKTSETAKDVAKPVQAEAPKAEETPKPTPAPAPAPTTAPKQEERPSVFFPLLLGGLVAGGIGYAASEYQWFSTRSGNEALVADISANADRLTTLESVEPVVVPEVDLSAVDDLSAQVTSLSDAITAFEDRLKIVEERPAPDGGPSIADQTAFEKELQALKATAEEQRVELEALLNNAQSVEEATAAAARAAQIQSAVSRITTAISSGQPFADTIAELGANDIDVPAALSDVAENGVATLSNLQSRFPDTARAALGVARTSGAMEGETGVGGFLKRQLGARSTAPREGSDPDAVLSRVEAAVRDGGLDTALSEIDTLPENVQSAMQDWLDDARARSAAERAAQDLSQSQPAN